MRHYRLCAPTEERQQVVDQLPLRGIAGDRSFENVKVTHLPDATHSILRFQAINGCLDRCLGRSAFFGESLLNLADGGLALTPQHLHDLKLELG